MLGVPDLSARPYPRIPREPMALSERGGDDVRSLRRAEESKPPCGNKTKIRREATVGTIISARDSSAAAVVDSPRRDGALISGGCRFVFPGRPAWASSRDSALYAPSARAQPDCSYRARRPACRVFLPRVSSPSLDFEIPAAERRRAWRGCLSFRWHLRTRRPICCHRRCSRGPAVLLHGRISVKCALCVLYRLRKRRKLEWLRMNTDESCVRLRGDDVQY